MVNHTMYSEDEDSQEEEYVNYKQKYRELKKNLRYLIYENECFQDELRKAQRNFVSMSRDKSFLLDRILKYEKPQGPSSDSEATESSDEDEEAKMPPMPAQFFNQRKKITKRKRSEAELHNGSAGGPSTSEPHPMHGHINPKQAPLRPIAMKPNAGKAPAVKRPKKPPAARKPSAKKEKLAERLQPSQLAVKGYHMEPLHVAGHEQVATSSAVLDGADYELSGMPSQGHMTREEVERHLEARRFSPELNTTATVPAELFSHEPEPDSELEEGEMCEYIQLEEDGQSGDMLLE